MPSHRKAHELATQFDRVYPQDLSGRVAWWCHVLGIYPPRFQRLMGLSAEEVTREKDTSWSELLNKKKEWEENAWWVEGKLHHLLALFDYDWKALSARLNHGEDTQREEPNHGARQRGDRVKLQYVPDNEGTETLLNPLAKGGPESFSALITYLPRERSS